MTMRRNVETRLTEVGESLTAAAGGRALCRPDGSLAPAKDLEGRMAALHDVRRALRADGEADLALILERWKADRDSRGHAGVAWRAYLNGAVAELEALVRGG